MAAFGKAEAEREVIKDTLNFLDHMLTTNATTPLLEAEVDTYQEQASEAKKEIMDNHRHIRQSAPKGTDMDPYVATYNHLLAQSTRVHAGFHGLKAKFPVSTAASSSSSATGAAASGGFKQKIKLPPLELPKFDGNLQDWVSFRDMFLNAVHGSSLTKVEKLTQLKSLLTGEASRQVKSIILSDANYDLAWKALQDRYENNRELLFSILRRLFNQPIVPANSSSSLRTLIDTTKECIRSMEVLLIPTQHWDAVLIYHLFNKLDSTSRELWEQSLPDTSIPTLAKMYDFLEQRARAMAASTTQTQRLPQKSQEGRVRAHHTAATTCKLGCHPGHPLFKCPKFQGINPSQRLEVIKKNNLCHNCLQDGHYSSTCNNKHTCKVCNKKHHTMVHLQEVTSNRPQQQREVSASTHGGTSNVTSHHTFQQDVLSAGVLATARIQILNAEGQGQLFRSLVDGGSTNSHITEKAARRMNLYLRPCHVPMTGLSSASVGVAKYVTSFNFSPHFSNFTTFTVTALVVKSIGQSIPSESLKRKEWTHLNNIELADPEYDSPGKVDVLLGTEIFWSALENDRISGAPGQPVGVKSSLGWLVGGANIASTPVTTFNTNAVLDASLRRFWEYEDIPESSTMGAEERACEEHFDSTHTRDSDGRFVVCIPWKTPRPPIGSSRQVALRRFFALERKSTAVKGSKDETKLQSLQQHWQEYKKFMEEYEILGHMSRVPVEEVSMPKNPTYFIPHHFVLKESSTTTKLRVVFDGSAPSSSGQSINDCMMVGPQLQDNLLDIMLRFRTHPVAFTADLEKMYRQIKVSNADADLQRILWRPDSSLPIVEYRLNTVTYGTASAPYLAVKCLQQLAKDGKQQFPEASAVALRDFFVDDLQSGTKTLEEAQQIVQQLIGLCMSGGLQLRKWTTNNLSLRASIPEELRETKSVIPIELENSFSVKTLGVFWNTSEDYYYFILNLPPDMPGQYTKRIILSEISKIYDPCGWLSPAIIVCKLFMQELWSVKADWDELLPSHTQDKWLQLKSSLKDLEPIRIPRCVIPRDPIRILLCGYSDASMVAYSASLYVCCQYEDSSTTSHLLTSKTRVAPIKAVTIPRLELNGALLLSELLQKVLVCLNIRFDEVRAYTDSTIVLHWILSSPQRWKTYVRHRVQKIQDRVPEAKWFHVPGEVNPADCASRGITSFELQSHPLWWTGGGYVWSHLAQQLSDITEEERATMEKEAQPLQIFFSAPMPLPKFFSKFSKFIMLQRVVAYILRFTQNCRCRQVNSPLQQGSLTVTEILNAQHLIFQILQQYCFPAEYHALKKNQVIPHNSNILNLKPFMCHNGTIRVGGRICRANLTFDRRHPILLPRSHHITTSIIMDIHLRNLHGGPSSTLSSLQNHYWVINARDAIRYELKKCVTCKRQRGEMMSQIMGDLPYHRVNPSRPFSKCGLDYAGPFSIRPLVRSKVTLKCWLAIFVCFATRAIHIEVVSSLSTDCFLAALRRFISRRGRPSDMFSDCGTNFKGADRVLRDFFVISTDKAVLDECSSQQIQWHFNPAGAPHFGGLWEAGVRSIKHHLVRVMGSSILTYEEMLTLVCQIEGILNSRPLIPASSDPSDLQALTPAHFLVGDAITSFPEPALMDIKENHLDRWQLLQQRQQLFWKRWSSEFISRLQQRPKWCRINPELQVGAMVIVKDERLPPMKWKLGRVMEVHPGHDGHVRVASVKTQDGDIRRPIVKLCLLPITQSD